MRCGAIEEFLKWTDHITNEEVLSRMKLEKPVLTRSLLHRKLMFIGHVIRGSAGKELEGLLKTTATTRGKGRGRKRTTWYMEAMKLTNGSFTKLQNLAIDRDTYHIHINRLSA